MYSKDREITTRVRERDVTSLKLPGFLKNEQSHYLFQLLKMCFIQNCQVKYCISSMLSFQRLSSLWDIDLVFILKSPHPLMDCVPAGPCSSWAGRLPLHITGFLQGKMQFMMVMVLARASEEFKVSMCPTAHQSLASAASIHPQCSQERCKAKYVINRTWTNLFTQ